MPKSPPRLQCSDPDRKTLEEWARSRTQEARLVERAKIILQCVQGHSVSDIARRLRVRPNTVIDWRRRFDREGLPGLGSGLIKFRVPSANHLCFTQVGGGHE